MSWINQQIDDLRSTLTDPYVSDTIKDSANNVLTAIFSKLDESENPAQDPELKKQVEEAEKVNARARRDKIITYGIVGVLSVGLLVGGFYFYKKYNK